MQLHIKITAQPSWSLHLDLFLRRILNEVIILLISFYTSAAATNYILQKLLIVI